MIMFTLIDKICTFKLLYPIGQKRETKQKYA